MTIAEYAENFDMKMLSLRKQTLLGAQASLENELSNVVTDHSNVTAAMTLKSYTLRPGDVIQINGVRRVRIEPESMDGKPMGQPVDLKGNECGRAIVLHDHTLSQARKVI